MQFAIPPRKPSQPPPYVAARQPRPSFLQRATHRSVLWIIAGILFVYLFWARRGGPQPLPVVIPADTPKVVIVTALDEHAVPPPLEQIILENRREYARIHGYATFIPKTKDYEVENIKAPTSWARIPAVRHAMTLYPHTQFFFYLDQHSLLMNPSLSIEAHILDRPRLESLMIPDQPIVPPDGVIHTFRGRRGDHIDLIVTQDREGLSPAAFIVRRGEWAKYFLDAWYDPLYRSYNFQKQEAHALEHLVQWHGTILARLALIPQKVMNAYTKAPVAQDAAFAQGDFVAHMRGCNAPGRSCADEAAPLYEQFQAMLRQLRSEQP